MELIEAQLRCLLLLSVPPGDVLNIDPLKFYTHLYKTLLTLSAGESCVRRLACPLVASCVSLASPAL